MQYCSQCLKPSVAQTENGLPLCVDCFLKFQQAMQIRHNRLLQECNYLTDSVEASIGIRGILPGCETPQPVTYQPLAFQNIKVDRSSTGSINVGNMKVLDVAMSHIKTAGDSVLADTLKSFTDAVLNTTEFNVQAKNEIVELISFLAVQAALPKEQRKTGIVRAVLSAIKKSMPVVGVVASPWNQLRPLFERVFAG